MTPRMGPIEIPPPKGSRDPRRDPSGPPIVSDPEVLSDRAQVAQFRAGVSVPAAVIVSAITAISGAAIAWINKPSPPPVIALTPEQSQALTQCTKLSGDVAKLEAWTHWAEPQIGLLFIRTESRAYTPPPPAP